jgi:hypothetical protein
MYAKFPLVAVPSDAEDEALGMSVLPTPTSDQEYAARVGSRQSAVSLSHRQDAR